MNIKRIGSLIKKFINIYRAEGFALALKRGAKNLEKLFPTIAFRRYRRWYEQHEPSLQELEQQRQHAQEMAQPPLISLEIPVFNPPTEILKETLVSVLNQTYQNWECCLANGDPANQEIRDLIDRYAQQDARFKVVHLEQNLGIAGNTNAAIAIAAGDYIGFVDHDDVLAPFALHEVASRLIANPHIDLVYSDEDKIDEKGRRFFPFFKPAYSPDYLRSSNYICHFLVVRKALGDRVGWIRDGFEGAQDYDFILRACEQARRIEHIPMVLYHWRTIQGSTAADSNAKPYAGASGAKAINEHLRRVGLPGRAESLAMPTSYRVRYEITGNPLVSIIIPNHDHTADLRHAVESILTKSTYENFELLIIENNSVEPETFALYEELKAQDARIRVLDWQQPFNYSMVNNWAARETRGDMLLFLNNDTEVITPGWIEELLMHAARPGVGSVGAKLYFPNNTIQHAGVVIGRDEVAIHAYEGFSRDMTGHGMQLVLTRNVAANTSACMMVSREAFDFVGGFDENYVLAYGDVDLCLRLLEAGRINVWTPFAELYHIGSSTRGYERTPAQIARHEDEVGRFKQRWQNLLNLGDLYFSQSLLKGGLNL
jgi:glycosyltransferase involved in cell wall biosynthesis